MFGANLSYYRMDRGLSKKELAQKAGISPMSVTYYEAGKRRPSVEVTRRLALALGISMSDLLTTYDPTRIRFDHSGLRQLSFSVGEKDYLRVQVEDEAARFLQLLSLLGRHITKPSPVGGGRSGERIRLLLSLPAQGPLFSFLPALEREGYLVLLVRFSSPVFFSGKAEGIPYLAFSSLLSPMERRLGAANLLLPMATKEDLLSLFLPERDRKLFFPDRKLRDGALLRRLCAEYGVPPSLLPLKGREEVLPWTGKEEPLLLSLLSEEGLERGLLSPEKANELSEGLKGLKKEEESFYTKDEVRKNGI